MLRAFRFLAQSLLITSLVGCGTTAPWYRKSAPKVPSSDPTHATGVSNKSEPPVLTDYDRFKDDTHVYTHPFYVVAESLAFSLHAYLHGNRTRLAKHEEPLLLLGFSSPSEDFRYSGPQNCIFIVNGRDRVDLGDGSPSADYLSFSVTPQLVTKIVSATTIEARLGTTEFTIAPPQLSPFRQLLEMIRAPQDSS